MRAHAVEKALPVPRFVSLRADEVNLRTGPGERYPIDWVLTRKGLPVEIVEEFEAWRKIRDAQGTEGWVHQRMVTGTRNVIVTGELRTLRADADAAAPAVARAEPGVIAHLLDCRDAWCRVELQGVKGWLKRSEVWGVYPTEAVP
jgi:SH3-like domain-containing protein